MTAALQGAHTIEAQKQDFLQAKATVAGPFTSLEEAFRERKRLDKEQAYPGCVLRVKTNYVRVPKERKGKTP